MTHSVFGWDLPPGCSNGDIERAFGGGDPPPCCYDCEVDPCDEPEKCEKYKKAVKQEEKFNKEQAQEMFDSYKEGKNGF